MKKDKLNYKLSHNGTYEFRKYAHAMTAALVDKKIAIDDYEGVDGDTLTQTRMERLDMLWVHWVKNKLKIPGFIDQRPKEFVDRMKIEMHYINELNAQLEETKLDIKIQRNQNKEVLRSNIDQLFDEHRFYLEKVDSYYRKWSIDADLLSIKHMRKKQDKIDDEYESKSQYNKEKSANVDLGVF